MEYFPAIDEEQYEYIKTIIDDSDFYVIVVAGTYGTLAPDGLSYCEKEYNYALERGLPVISLLHRDVDSLPASKQEKDPEVRTRLEAFRKRLADRRLAAFWKDETELCLALVGSLAATAKRHPRFGWELRLYYYVRTSQTDLTPIEGSKDVSWQETAAYVLPRIRKQTSVDRFEQIVLGFVESVSEDPVVSVAKSTIGQVRVTFRRFGLIGDFTTVGGEDIIVTSNLGAEFAHEGIKNYENERRRKEGFAVVVEDWTVKFHRWITKRTS
jgi:hypothetical protein